MKKIITLFSIFLGFNVIVSSQTIHNLDDYTGTSHNGNSKTSLLKAQTQTSTNSNVETLSMEEVQNIQDLTSSIEATLYQYGEVINIAKERHVPCVKADVDISTFLQFTSSDNDRKDMLAACQDVQLIRFSLYTDKDFEQAKNIDFTMFKQFPNLKYIVFYVSPSIYQQSSETLEREQVESQLRALTADKIDIGSIKLAYRIPQGG